MHEIRNRSKSDVDPLIKPLDASLFQIVGLMIFFFVVEVSVCWMTPRLAALSFKRCPHVQQTIPSLQYDKHSLHCVLGSVCENSKFLCASKPTINNVSAHNHQCFRTPFPSGNRKRNRTCNSCSHRPNSRVRVATVASIDAVVCSHTYTDSRL